MDHREDNDLCWASGDDSSAWNGKGTVAEVEVKRTGFRFNTGILVLVQYRAATVDPIEGRK